MYKLSYFSIFTLLFSFFIILESYSTQRTHYFKINNSEKYPFSECKNGFLVPGFKQKLEIAYIYDKKRDERKHIYYGCTSSEDGTIFYHGRFSIFPPEENQNSSLKIVSAYRDFIELSHERALYAIDPVSFTFDSDARISVLLPPNTHSDEIPKNAMWVPSPGWQELFVSISRKKNDRPYVRNLTICRDFRRKYKNPGAAAIFKSTKPSCESPKNFIILPPSEKFYKDDESNIIVSHRRGRQFVLKNGAILEPLDSVKYKCEKVENIKIENSDYVRLLKFIMGDRSHPEQTHYHLFNTASMRYCDQILRLLRTQTRG